MNLKVIVLLVAVTFAACNSVHSNANSPVNNANAATPAAATQSHDSVKRVTTAELEDLMKQGKVVVVDVRNKAMYDIGHIPGAKLIPVGEVPARANELPRDKMIVTYCS